MIFNDDEPILTLPDSGSRPTPVVPGKVQLTSKNINSVPLKESKLKVLLELTGGDSTSDRPGLDLVVVLDVSDKMPKEKLEKLEIALLSFIKKLSSIDRLSIVTFNDYSTRLCPLMQITEASQKYLKSLISCLVNSGETNIRDGLETGLKVLNDRKIKDGRVAAILLMSTGEETRGLFAAQVPVGSVPVHTFGFGVNHEPRVLKAIAANSLGGTFSDVQNTEDLSKAFSVCLGYLLTAVVQELNLTVTGVEDESIICHVSSIGYTQTKDDEVGSVTVSLGDLYSKELCTILVDLLLPEKYFDCAADVLEISYSYRTGGKLFEAPQVFVVVKRIETITEQEEWPEFITEEIGIITEQEERLQFITEETGLEDIRVMAFNKNLLDFKLAEDAYLTGDGLEHHGILETTMEELQQKQEDDEGKGKQKQSDTISPNEHDKASWDNLGGSEIQPVLKEILSEVTAVSKRNDDTPLHVAAGNRNLTTALILIRQAKQAGNDYSLHMARNGQGHTALHLAVMNGFHTLVSWYAQLYKEVFEEIVKHEYHQLLLLAAKAMDKGSFQEILSVLPSVFPDRPGFQQIMEATSDNAYTYVQDALSSNILEFEEIKTAYFATVKDTWLGTEGVNDEKRRGKQPKETSSKEKVSLDELDKDSWISAMFEATKHGSVIDCSLALSKLRISESQAVSTQLLSQGDPSGNSLLHAAVTNGKPEVVEYIISEILVPLFCTNFYGDTPLHVAARGGHLPTFKKILRHAQEEVKLFSQYNDEYIFIKARNGNGHTVLHEAIMNGNHSMVQILASEYKDEFESIVQHEFHDLLTLAVKAYDKAIFKQILSVPPTSSSNTEQIKAAYAAIVKESESKLEELKSGGHFFSGLNELFADKEQMNKDFVDAFDKLGRRERRAILIFPSENPWFHVAISKGYYEIVEHIASNFFTSFLHRNESGDTPLHVAARCGQLLIFQNLLHHAKEEGQDFGNNHNDLFLLKAKNNQGYTALHEVVKNGCHAILEFFASEYKGMFETIVKENYKDLLVLAVKAYDKACFCNILSVLKSGKKKEDPYIVHASFPSLLYYITDKEFNHIEVAYIPIIQGESGDQLAMDATLQNEKDKVFEAAKNGNAKECLDALKKLQRSLSRYEFMKIVNKGGPSSNSLLHVAASNGNDELVESIVTNFFAMFHRINCCGDTPLHLAAKGGHLLTFQNLLCLAKEEGQYFGHPNESSLLMRKNEKGHTTLHEAVMNGNHLIVEFFASQYKYVFEATVTGDYANLLLLAVKSYDKASFEKMLRVSPTRTSSILKSKQIKDAYGAIIKEHEDGRGKSDKLNWAEEVPQEPMEDNSTHGGLLEDENKDVKKFLEAFFELKAKTGQSTLEILSKEGQSGNSLLHEAVTRGKFEIVEHIASNFFCQIFNKNWQQDTPFHVAARNGHLQALEILLCETKKEGEYFGIEGRDYRLVKEKNMQGQTALHEAVLDGKVETVAFLVNRHEEIIDEYKDEDHPLKIAIKYNDTKILEALLPALKRSLSSNSHDDAAKEAHRSVMFDVAKAAIVNGTGTFQKMLAEIPSIVHLTDKEGRSLLHWAAELDNPIAVEKLLEVSERKRTVFRADNSGRYPIHIACEQGHIGILKQFVQTQRKTLLRNNLPINLIHIQMKKFPLNREKQNILHIAAANGNDRVVQYILTTLETGEKDDELVKQEDQHGNTPLHLAAENSHPNVVLSLARYKKVTLNPKNKEGFTPLDVFWKSKKNQSALRHSLTSSALRSLGCCRRWELDDGRDKGYHSKKRKWERSDSGWIKNQVAALSTAATLVATVTFTAGFTVPGGYNGSDGPDKGIGALLHKPMFQVFTISNTLSFFLSILSILSCFYATDKDDLVSENAFGMAKRLFGIALFMMATTFVAAIFLGVSKLTWLACLIIVIGSLFLNIIFFFESLQSLVPFLMNIPCVRYIPYSITRAMAFIFVKDHAG